MLLIPESVLAAETEKIQFSDPFDGKLADGWKWLSEDPAQWRIKEGKLQMLAMGGSSWQGSKNGKNYLMRKPPEVTEGDLAIEVFAENKPTNAFEHVGLWWYYDDDNYVTLNKELFGGKQEVLFVVEKAGKGQPPYGQIPYEAEGIWLRLRVSGTKITGQFRAKPDDQWQTAGSRELPAKGEPLIGVHGGYAPAKEVDRWTSYSQFRIFQMK